MTRRPYQYGIVVLLVVLAFAHGTIAADIVDEVTHCGMAGSAMSGSTRDLCVCCTLPKQTVTTHDGSVVIIQQQVKRRVPSITVSH